MNIRVMLKLPLMEMLLIMIGNMIGNTSMYARFVVEKDTTNIHVMLQLQLMEIRLKNMMSVVYVDGKDI